MQKEHVVWTLIFVCWRSPGRSQQTPGPTEVFPDGLPEAGKGKRCSLGQADQKTKQGYSSCLCDQHDKCGKVRGKKSRRGDSIK